jgi:hypothetical protein
MNRFFTNLFKALGVLALSALIFFLFEPKKEIKNQAVDLALEFLGKKLLAMVPTENEPEIAARFEEVRNRARKGEIDNEQLQNFSAIVLNAEAEEQPVALMKIDSALAALHKNEAAIRKAEARRAQEEARLEEWAHRVQEFERFEKRWHTFAPDPGASEQIHASRKFRPWYRLSKQFVVQIDSAALASAIAVSAATRGDSMPPHLITGHFPPPPHVRTFVRQLEGDLPGLRLELHPGAFERQRHWADSVRARARGMAREARGVEAVTPNVPAAPKPETQPGPRKN